MMVSVAIDNVTVVAASPVTGRGGEGDGGAEESTMSTVAAQNPVRAA